jgi:undecaprenyl diphosphate synthase
MRDRYARKSHDSLETAQTLREPGRTHEIPMSEAAMPIAAATDLYGAPRHVAIIMDGNGRWAAARGFPRGEGHRRGVEALRRTVRAACDLGIQYLTIFSFSAENWSRPVTEIRELMGLLRRFIRHDLADLHRNNVKVRIIGERVGLDRQIATLLDEAEELTRGNDGLTLVVAFNYGARQEIARAARRMAEAVAAGRLAPAAITAESMASYLDAPDVPDPDLIIRTSGELRLSNFLLWQAAYSELVFVPTFWPDFDRSVLEGAIAEYHRRERRFGGLIARTGS